MKSRILNYFLILFILLDTIFSFYRYYHTALDGDMAQVIIPNVAFEKVMHDPFGKSAILNNETYAISPSNAVW